MAVSHALVPYLGGTQSMGVNQGYHPYDRSASVAWSDLGRVDGVSSHGSRTGYIKTSSGYALQQPVSSLPTSQRRIVSVTNPPSEAERQVSSFRLRSPQKSQSPSPPPSLTSAMLSGLYSHTNSGMLPDVSSSVTRGEPIPSRNSAFTPRQEEHSSVTRLQPVASTASSSGPLVQPVAASDIASYIEHRREVEAANRPVSPPENNMNRDKVPINTSPQSSVTQAYRPHVSWSDSSISVPPIDGRLQYDAPFYNDAPLETSASSSQRAFYRFSDAGHLLPPEESSSISIASAPSSTRPNVSSDALVQPVSQSDIASYVQHRQGQRLATSGMPGNEDDDLTIIRMVPAQAEAVNNVQVFRTVLPEQRFGEANLPDVVYPEAARNLQSHLDQLHSNQWSPIPLNNSSLAEDAPFHPRSFEADAASPSLHVQQSTVPERIYFQDAPVQSPYSEPHVVRPSIHIQRSPIPERTNFQNLSPDRSRPHSELAVEAQPSPFRYSPPKFSTGVECVTQNTSFGPPSSEEFMTPAPPFNGGQMYSSGLSGDIFQNSASCPGCATASLKDVYELLDQAAVHIEALQTRKAVTVNPNIPPPPEANLAQTFEWRRLRSEIASQRARLQAQIQRQNSLLSTKENRRSDLPIISGDSYASEPKHNTSDLMANQKGPDPLENAMNSANGILADFDAEQERWKCFGEKINSYLQLNTSLMYPPEEYLALKAPKDGPTPASAQQYPADHQSKYSERPMKV